MHKNDGDAERPVNPVGHNPGPETQPWWVVEIVQNTGHSSMWSRVLKGVADCHSHGCNFVAVADRGDGEEREILSRNKEGVAVFDLERGLTKHQRYRREHISKSKDNENTAMYI